MLHLRNLLVKAWSGNTRSRTSRDQQGGRAISRLWGSSEKGLTEKKRKEMQTRLCCIIIASMFLQKEGGGGGAEKNTTGRAESGGFFNYLMQPSSTTEIGGNRLLALEERKGLKVCVERPSAWNPQRGGRFSKLLFKSSSREGSEEPMVRASEGTMEVGGGGHDIITLTREEGGGALQSKTNTVIADGPSHIRRSSQVMLIAAMGGGTGRGTKGGFHVCMRCVIRKHSPPRLLQSVTAKIEEGGGRDHPGLQGLSSINETRPATTVHHEAGLRHPYQEKITKGE